MNTNTVQTMPDKQEKNKEKIKDDYEVKNEVLCWSINGWFYGDQKTYEICKKEYDKYFNVNKK